MCSIGSMGSVGWWWIGEVLKGPKRMTDCYRFLGYIYVIRVYVVPTFFVGYIFVTRALLSEYSFWVIL